MCSTCGVSCELLPPPPLLCYAPCPLLCIAGKQKSSAAVEAMTSQDLRQSVIEEEGRGDGVDGRLPRLLAFISGFSDELTVLGHKVLLHDVNWRRWLDEVKKVKLSLSKDDDTLWDSQRSVTTSTIATHMHISPHPRQQRPHCSRCAVCVLLHSLIQFS
jgi:hypothetical protein